MNYYEDDYDYDYDYDAFANDAYDINDEYPEDEDYLEDDGLNAWENYYHNITNEITDE